MPTIWSKQTGLPHEVSQEVLDSLLTSEWERGLEMYATDAPPTMGAKP